MSKKIFNFSNTYSRLPGNFYEKIKPVPVKNPKLEQYNFALSKYLNIDPKKISEETGRLVFSGNQIPHGATPIAMAYAGHQFGSFVPKLGDGRAILIGELITKNGERFDLQLKGSGRTSFSRQGDGRSPIGPVIREYVVSEALHYLGIKSTRSLAVVSTGETVIREKSMPGGILTRIASSHIRIGTFEYFYYRKDFKSLKKLVEYTIQRHFSDESEKNPYESLLKAVIKSQANLISKWMSIGFIHGVMNTDNTSISGETIDFGPCAFMDHFDPNRVFSYIDHSGRYSFSNQGKVMLWNLSKFAECLLPFLNEDLNKSRKKAIDILNIFPEYFNKYWLKEMSKKIGISNIKKKDQLLINDLLKILADENLDFTLSFRNLSKVDSYNDNIFFDKIKDKKKFGDWINRWNKRLQYERKDISKIKCMLDDVNPAYIPRNHIIEKIITAAEDKNDFSPMKKLLSIIEKPFVTQNVNIKYESAPKPHEIVSNTFCGT